MTQHRNLFNYLLLLLIALKGVLPGAVASNIVEQHNALIKGDVLLLCSAGKLRYVSASTYFEHGLFVDVEVDDDFLADGESPQAICPLEQYSFQLNADDSIVPLLYLVSQRQLPGKNHCQYSSLFVSSLLSIYVRGPPVSPLIS